MANPNGQNPYPPGYPQQQHPPAEMPPPGYAPGGQAPYPPGAGPSVAPDTGGMLTRRAPSRTLPIVVGVGVAIGVFSGLMIIRGPSSEASGGDDGDELEVLETTEIDRDEGQGDGTEETDPDGDEAVAAGAGADAGVEAVAVTIDAAPPEPETFIVALRFNIEPREAQIEVDGEAVAGDEVWEVELAEGEEKSVKVVANAKGYRPHDETVVLAAADEEKTIEIQLDKIVRKPPRRRPNRRGGRNNNRGRRGSGGLIDL